MADGDYCHFVADFKWRQVLMVNMAIFVDCRSTSAIIHFQISSMISRADNPLTNSVLSGTQLDYQDIR